MSALNLTSFSAAKPFRILSMDGGGIYGLCTALMLKKLAAKDDDFLRDDSISMFVGTSAGALNALFLAKQTNPRECVLSGELESFWAEAGIYSNTADPVSAVLSLFGITAFMGTQDFLILLQKYFGDLTLGELPQHVLIDTFDWSGMDTPRHERRTWQPKPFSNFPEDEADRQCRVVDIAFGAAAPPGLRAVRDGLGDGGIFAPNPSMNGLAKAIQHLATPRQQAQGSDAYEDLYIVIDALLNINLIRRSYLDEIEPYLEQNSQPIAWAQGTLNMLTGYRAALPDHLLDRDGANAIIKQIKQDIDDLTSDISKQREVTQAFILNSLKSLGRLFANELKLAQIFMSHVAPNIALDDELEILQKFINDIFDDLKSNQLISFFRLINVSAEALYSELKPKAPEVLDRIALLSVGVCTMRPFYWLRSFNLGSSLFFNVLPTNISLHDWYPPMYQIMLQAPSGSTNMQAAQLIGPAFHRLNPHIVGPPATPPALVATALARFTTLRQWLIQQIYSLTHDNADVAEAIEEALAFVNSEHWQGRQHFFSEREV